MKEENKKSRVKVLSLILALAMVISLEVKDAGNGRVYGKISDVLRTGANDVYEIKDADGKTYLAPVIDDVVKEINVNDGYVLIVPMKGIFDDED